MNNANIKLYYTSESILNTEGTLISPCVLTPQSYNVRVYYLQAPQYVRIQRIADRFCTRQIKLTPEIYWFSDVVHQLFYAELIHAKSIKPRYFGYAEYDVKQPFIQSTDTFDFIDLNSKKQQWTCCLHTKISLTATPIYQYESVENYDNVTTMCATG